MSEGVVKLAPENRKAEGDELNYAHCCLGLSMRTSLLDLTLTLSKVPAILTAFTFFSKRCLHLCQSTFMKSEPKATVPMSTNYTKRLAKPYSVSIHPCEHDTSSRVQRFDFRSQTACIHPCRAVRALPVLRPPGEPHASHVILHSRAML